LDFQAKGLLGPRSRRPLCPRLDLGEGSQGHEDPSAKNLIKEKKKKKKTKEKKEK